MKIATVAEAVSNDVRALPRVARELGFSGVQFDARSSVVNLKDLSISGRKEFRHLLSTYSQQLVGLRLSLPGEGLGSGEDLDQAISLLDEAMEIAAGLGSPLVCADLGRLPEPPPDAKPPPAAISAELAGLLILPSKPAKPKPAPVPGPPRDEEAESQVDAAIAEICRRADRYGVMLAIRSDLSSFAAIDRAIRPTACPWFGVDLDPAAIMRDAWTMDENFSRLGMLIRHVRGHDATKGSDRRTKPAAIGAGSTDWKVLLSNLDEAEYRGWITVDPEGLPDRTSAARAGRERLSRMLF